MSHTSAPRSTSVLSLGLVALLAFAGGRSLVTEGEARSDGPVDRYQIRVVAQSGGATAVVMVDSVTGESWAQRLAAGREASPWLALGKPE
jgi:hypothetical protein